MSREAFEKWLKNHNSIASIDKNPDDSYWVEMVEGMWQAWQARDNKIEKKDKRIAELERENTAIKSGLYDGALPQQAKTIAELKEALEKHGRHLADCTFLPNWIDEKCNCGLFEALAKVKGE